MLLHRASKQIGMQCIVFALMSCTNDPRSAVTHNGLVRFAPLKNDLLAEGYPATPEYLSLIPIPRPIRGSLLVSACCYIVFDATNGTISGYRYTTNEWFIQPRKLAQVYRPVNLTLTEQNRLIRHINFVWSPDRDSPRSTVVDGDTTILLLDGPITRKESGFGAGKDINNAMYEIAWKHGMKF